MGWGSGIGVVFLTTVLGGFAAFGLSFFLIWFLEISNFEGGAGYFTLFVTLFGVAGGFVVGFIAAVSMTSSFTEVLLRGALVVVGLTVAAGIAGVLSKVFEDKGPKLEGDSIRLEVEYKCPRDWKPRYAPEPGHAGCFLQKYPENGPLESNPIVSGSLTWDQTPAHGEPWTITCAVPLQTTASPRNLSIYFGKKFELTFQIPLPRHPGPQFKEWSAWSSDGFLPQKNFKTPPEGYAFRFRVHKELEYSAAHPSPDEAFKQLREKLRAAMPPSPTVADWLPFYESAAHQPTSHTDTLGPEVEAVNDHPEQLVPLLRSDDITVARRAMFATTFLKTVPPSLIEPLAHTGLQTIPLIRAARAGALPDDPDEVSEEQAWSFLIQWKIAMDHAGAKDQGRTVLEQIAAELESGPKDEKLERMAAAVNGYLSEINAPK